MQHGGELGRLNTNMIRPAKGMFIGVGDGGGPETFNALINCTSVTLPTTTWKVEDTTNHGNTTPVSTCQTTIRDDGKIAITLSPYLETDDFHAQMRALSMSGASNNFRFTYPYSELGSFDISGTVTSFVPSVPVDGIYKATFEIMADGEITDVPGLIASDAFTDAHHPTYVTGQVMTLTVMFDEIVEVTGTPFITMNDPNLGHLLYTSGTNSNTLVFAHTVLVDESALEIGVTLGSAISGTIVDLGGNVVNKTLPTTFFAYTVN